MAKETAQEASVFCGTCFECYSRNTLDGIDNNVVLMDTGKEKQ